MTPLARTTLAASCGAALLAFPGVADASFYGKHRGPLPNIGNRQLGPINENDIDIIENLGEKVPTGLSFVDSEGQKVPLSSVLGQGKPVVVTMGYYTCPMLCDLVHQGLVKAIREAKLQLGRDLLGFSVSIDPKEDFRMADNKQGLLLRARADQKKSDWPFTMDHSPDAKVAATLAQAVGFRYKYDPQSKQYAHAAVAFVLTPEGTIARYLYGVDFSARDFRMAVVEASGGRVGTSLDRVLQFCFKYDPMTQRYTPYAMAFVRIGAGLSCLALMGLLAVLWRRELVLRRRRLA